MPDAPPPEEDFVVYPDKRKAVKALNKRMLFKMLPLILFFFAFFGALYYGMPVLVARQPGMPSPAALRAGVPAISSFMLWAPWIFVVEMALLYSIQRRKVTRQTMPIVVMSRDGIYVDTHGKHIGKIRWDEISEIRPCTFFNRFIGIVVKDSVLRTRQMSAYSALLLRLNNGCIPIPEQNLPIPADELMQRIRAYQTAYSHPVTYDAPQEGVWPPPPRPPD